MKLTEVSVCPVSGETGYVKYSAAVDAFFGTEGKWCYRQNMRTGHLWLDPRPQDEEIPNLYVNYYTHSQPRKAASVWQRAVKILLARRLGYPKPGTIRFFPWLVSFFPSLGRAADLEMMCIPAHQTGCVLDVGCGSGAFLHRMRDAGWRVAGIEPDPNASARLRGEYGFPVFASINEALAVDQCFDVITLNHVIEHVSDPVETLKRLSHLLAPGGRIIITTPNALSIGSRIFGSFWRGLEPPRHFNVFTFGSLAEAVQRAGLCVERMTSEVRLARGIFYLSYLARKGYRGIEGGGHANYMSMKIGGYIFQLVEAAVTIFFSRVGEEIFCVANFVAHDEE